MAGQWRALLELEGVVLSCSVAELDHASDLRRCTLIAAMISATLTALVAMVTGLGDTELYHERVLLRTHDRLTPMIFARGMLIPT